MKSPEDLKKILEKDRMLIFEMIDASYELATKKGKHPLENGCNCISCVNKRKLLIKQPEKKWKFWL